MLFCIYTNVKGKLRHLDRISFLYNITWHKTQNHTKVVQSPKSLSFISGERPRPPARSDSLIEGFGGENTAILPPSSSATP